MNNLEILIKYWKESKDEMMVNLAESIEKDNKLPTEEELIELLAFFQTFAMGCMEMALDVNGNIIRQNLVDIAKKFENRETIFRIGLNKMGFVPGKWMNYVKAQWADNVYNRIVKIASSRTTYRMCDLSRDLLRARRKRI